MNKILAEEWLILKCTNIKKIPPNLKSIKSGIYADDGTIIINKLENFLSRLNKSILIIGERLNILIPEFCCNYIFVINIIDANMHICLITTVGNVLKYLFDRILIIWFYHSESTVCVLMEFLQEFTFSIYRSVVLYLLIRILLAFPSAQFPSQTFYAKWHYWNV